MPEIKTKKNKGSVTEFLNSIDNPTRRKDSIELLKIFKEATGMKPVMWGASIIGFGMYHYKSERSSQEGDWPIVAFSPRKQNLSIYIMPGFDNYKSLLDSLGKHKTGVGCLYINKLSDIDIPTLEAIIKRSVEEMRKRYPDAFFR